MRNILFWLSLCAVLFLWFSPELVGLPALIQTYLGVSRNWAFAIINAGVDLAIAGAYFASRRPS